MSSAINSVDDIAKLVRARRKEQAMTQAELALVSNVGLRFISEIENGKESCQIGLVLKVLKSLGLRLENKEFGLASLSSPNTPSGPKL